MTALPLDPPEAALTDNTTPEPQETRQQGLQHISIPLAQAMAELLQRAALVQVEEQTQEQ